MSEQIFTLEQALELAQQQAAQGQVAQAEQLLKQILQLQNNYAPAWHQLGILYAQAEELEAALAPLQKTVALQENNPDYHNDLGNVYLSLKRLEEAEMCFRTALQYQPYFSVALHNLGAVYYHKAQFAEAEKHVRSALQLNPQYVKAHYTLGTIFLELEGCLDKAFDEFQKTLELAPDSHLPVYQGLAKVSTKQGHIQTALNYLYKAFQQDSTNKDALSSFLFNLNYLPTYTTAQIFAYHQQFSDVFEKSQHIVKQPLHRLPQQPLRIGYVSEDFRDAHPVAYFMKSILAHHDKNKFKIYCYALHDAKLYDAEDIQTYQHVWIDCFN